MWPVILLWDMGVSTMIVQLIAGIVGLEIVFRMWRRRVYYLKVRDYRKGHTWCSIDEFDCPSRCNICEQMLLAGGMVCDSCGICADSGCIKKANKRILCKPVESESTSMKHHWVKGNLSPESTCQVCESYCGVENHLSDFRCSWCQWTVHEKCLPNLADLCTLGTFRNFIIPPNCITLKIDRRVVLRSQCKVLTIRDPQWGPKWKPIIVIGNGKSGSSEACHVLSSARKVLNAVQAIDLANQEPMMALQLCTLLRDTQCRLLIAGGDGTISWVLNTVQDLNMKIMPETALLPLGTGNDLSCSLGWGGHMDSDLDFPALLKHIDKSPTKPLDRWFVEVSPSRHLGFRLPCRSVRFNNYFSVGVDARVALNFHLTRQSPLYLFSHRLFNKLIYMTYGTKDVMEQSCEGLEEQVTLFIDDKPVELCPIQGIILLNIESWGGGCKPWHLGPGGSVSMKSDFGDGIIEVMGVTSSFHIAQMQFGLSEPLRLGRGRKVKLVLHSCLPVQADGEPWEQSPSEITIDSCGQVPVLIG